jgi:hypothetical protein
LGGDDAPQRVEAQSVTDWREGEMPVTQVRDAVMGLGPVAGAIGCIQCVPRSVVRVLLNETAHGDGEQWQGLVSDAQRRDAFAQKKIQQAAQEQPRPKSRCGDWRLDENGLLRYKGRLFIPEDASIRQELIRSAHDHPLAGHFAARRTHNLLI